MTNIDYSFKGVTNMFLLCHLSGFFWPPYYQFFHILSGWDTYFIKFWVSWWSCWKQPELIIPAMNNPCLVSTRTKQQYLWCKVWLSLVRNVRQSHKRWLSITNWWSSVGLWQWLLRAFCPGKTLSSQQFMISPLKAFLKSVWQTARGFLSNLLAMKNLTHPLQLLLKTFYRLHKESIWGTVGDWQMAINFLPICWLADAITQHVIQRA